MPQASSRGSPSLPQTGRFAGRSCGPLGQGVAKAAIVSARDGSVALNDLGRGLTSVSVGALVGVHCDSGPLPAGKKGLEWVRNPLVCWCAGLGLRLARAAEDRAGLKNRRERVLA